MDIYPEDYAEITKKLSVGQVRKVPHKGCSLSNVLRIESTVEGYKMYCFKCAQSSFTSTFNSPLERARRQKSFDAYREAKANISYELPLDFSQQIPSEGLSWLGKGGFTVRMIERYNVGYSNKLARVIIPVGNLGYLARAVESWQRPKYLEKVPQGVMWESNQAPTERPSACAVCEDILSAGRCGEIMKAYSLLGTTLSTTQLSTLMKYQKIYLWLDGDRAGEIGIKKSINRLRMFSKVQIVRSSVDPKLMTNKQIKELLR